jgi:uncharacterized protein involved in exopolysaccharide biosynthesis
MPDIGFLIQLFLRRLHYVVLIAAPVTMLGLWLALNLPPSYSAQARLLVESPQVPDELAASTLRIETTEILRVLEQRMLARGNMLALSRRFGLHADEPEMTADDIVADMRARVFVGLPSPRDPAAFMTLGFDASSPDVSAEVVGELVTQITRNYAELRTRSTRQTSDFFESEVDRLQQELDAQRARVLEFQEANKDALPDSLNYRRTRQTALQERLVQINRELDRLNERRERMVTLFEQTGQLAFGPETMTPEQAEMQRLRRELSQARSVYASGHPRLQALERRIATLEGTGDGDADTARPTSMLDIELTDMDGQMDFLARQKSAIEDELADLETTIAATPGNSVTYGALVRDLENIQAQYNGAVARQAEARIGERVEAQSQGRRLTVVEPPVPPTAPTKPNRKKIAAAGGAAGIALGVGIVGLIELLNPAVRRPVDLTRAMGVAPFATLPVMRTRRQALLRRGGIALMLLLAVAAIPAGLWAVNQYYMPLDMVLDRVANRTGLDALRAMLRDPAG